MRSPALLSFNPELQRNLWLELTLPRLVAAPLALLALLGGVGWVFSPEAAAKLAKPVLWALLSLWGSRLAAESFGEEATGRTWDVQRLSAQTAWGLTLGKLAGGTAFVWYGAAICAVILLLLQAGDVGGTIYTAVLAGLTAQSTAFFMVLLLHRFDGRARRAHATLAQIVGVVAGWNSDALSLAPRMQSTFGIGTIDWYGFEFPAKSFFAAIQAAAIAWFVFGSMRMIRRELGFQDGPLGWSLYTIYTIALVAGFVPGTLDSRIATGGMSRMASLPSVALGMQSLVGIAAFTLTYMAVLGTPVSRVALAKLFASAASRNWLGVWRNLPIWVPSAIAAAIVAVFLSLRLASSALMEPTAATPIAALGFLLRDVGLVTLLRLIYRQRTAVALLVMFVFLYALLPALLARPGGGMLMPLFYPDRHPNFAGLILPWLEAAAAWFMAGRRWRASPRPV
jgi:hypothetical protein